ncbi:MAG: WD40/YVTN/BNR-like repeat-containing protein, partial [Croceimicrobium sp.]
MQRILLIAAFLSLNLVYAQDSIPQKFLNDIEFRSIGPAGMSGRITAIKVDPRNENHIYAGSASGGLWESRNGGTSWDCIFNNEAVSSVGAIALDPHNPDLIWLGTGEGNPRNSNTGGAGLYRSLDGGKTWKLMGLEQSRHIHRVIVHPHQSNTIYVAAIGNPWADSEHRGVYKSTDGGESWERILYNNERTGAAEMVMDPQNPEKLIVNMWEHRRNPWFFKSGGKGSGLYITYDGGKTWEQKTEKHGLPKGELGRMGIAIAASQPDRIYALVEKKGKNALYRSDNGGAKWRMISQDENIGNRPFYYAEIYVDPQNENRVYSIWSVISRSEDGGKNWQVIAPYNYIHPDHHAFFIHPENPSYIINGNDGGLNISRDRGESWRFVNNLPLAQFYHISYDME